MPASRASSIAVSAARAITRWPMPLSPSTSAVAAAVFSTRMFGLRIDAAAVIRFTYFGSRNTPWASAPVRSASASARRPWRRPAGQADRTHRVRDEARRSPAPARATRCPLSPRTRLPFARRRVGRAEQRLRLPPEYRLTLRLGDRQGTHLPDAVRCTHVVRIIAAQHDLPGADRLHQKFERRFRMQDGVVDRNGAARLPARTSTKLAALPSPSNHARSVRPGKARSRRHARAEFSAWDAAP